MNARGLSPKTKKYYNQIFEKFRKFIKKNIEDSKDEDIKKYLSYLHDKKKYSNISLNGVISALKFIKNVYREEIDIKRPK